MADTAAVSESQWKFWTVLGPYIGQALVLIVTLLVGVGGTIATQKLTAPARPEAALVIPAADKDKTAPVTERAFVTAVGVFEKRFDAQDEALKLMTQEVQALRGERTDKVLPAAAVVKARPKPKATGLFEGLPAPFGK